MGGLAALAREAGHRVTGCDANVYPPMSDQLEALGIELIEGYDADQLDARARPVRRRQRRHARQPADGGDPRRRLRLHVSGPQWLAEHVLQRPLGARGRRHARQDDDDRRCSRGSSSTPGSSPGFLIGGVPLELRRVGAARRRARSSSSRPTSTTPRSSTSAPSSCTTGRAPRSSTTSSSTTPTSSPTSPRSRRQFHHLVRTVPAHGPARRQRREASAAARARAWAAGARCSASARARRSPARCARAASRMPSTCCAAACKVARVEWALLGEHNQLNALAAIAAARARRRRRPKSRRARSASFRERAGAGWSCAATVARHHASTTTSRTTRPRSRTTLDGLRRKVGDGAHPRRARAALEHDEARRDEGAAAVGARGGRPRRSATPAASAGTRREALAPLGAQAVVCATIDELVARGRRRRAARATTCCA